VNDGRQKVGSSLGWTRYAPPDAVNTEKLDLGIIPRSDDESAVSQTFNKAPGVRNIMAQSLPDGRVDRFFEEIEIGETHEVDQARTITEADVANYAGVAKDFASIHLSKSVGEETSYSKRIVPGNLVFIIMEQLLIEQNVKGLASYGHDNLRFIEPVLISDTISAKREVVDKEQRDDVYGKVVYRYTAYNQHEEKVCTDDHSVMVRTRDQEDE
jgi:acyl dehydratase